MDYVATNSSSDEKKANDSDIDTKGVAPTPRAVAISVAHFRRSFTTVPDSQVVKQAYKTINGVSNELTPWCRKIGPCACWCPAICCRSGYRLWLIAAVSLVLMKLLQE